LSAHAQAEAQTGTASPPEDSGGPRWLVLGYALVPADGAVLDGRMRSACDWHGYWGELFGARAPRDGHHLAGMFWDYSPDAAGLPGFYALVSQVRASAVVAVLVPDLRHLSVVPALAGTDEAGMRRWLRARILTLT